MESGFAWAPFGRATATSETPAPTSPIPARRLAVVTCMDARVDVLRSLEASRAVGGTTAVVIVAHSDCRAHGGDDDAARAAAREGVERVRAELPALEASGVLYDLASGRVSPV